MAAELQPGKISLGNWISENTEFERIKHRLLQAPSRGISAWMRTTAGVVAFLFFLQFLTGILLAFQYVPTVENAYTTVAYIEQAIKSGSFVRSLHYHSSILLPVALLAHLGQMIGRRVYARDLTAWSFCLLFLALVLAAGATGYALPWDARAFNGVNIAVALAGNVPFIGTFLKSWLQNGTDISTLTLSRFYGLHVFIVPFLILLSVAARVFFFGKNKAPFDASEYGRWLSGQLIRNAVVIGLLFFGLALFSARFSAPFGPPAADSANYLPRPGPQFLWLFEMQKYTDGPVAACLAFGLPALVIGGLFAIPLILKTGKFKIGRLGTATMTAIFLAGIGLIGGLTALAVYQDLRDPRIKRQLAEQEKTENEFRNETFKPRIVRLGLIPEKLPESRTGEGGGDGSSDPTETASAVPNAYRVNCAKCHGANGEGTTKFPPLTGTTTRDEDRLSDEALIEIINDPKAYGLSAEMPSFKDKMTEEEKREIVDYIKSLK
ncbi:MAG: cytochrome b N-terminal domain-containing protein [Pyrinomonadaceae bacterium]